MVRNLHLLDLFRITDKASLAIYNGWAGDHECGAFLVPSRIDGQTIMVVASVGEGWDHVSVSRRNRCPNWQEMEQIATMFFKDDEAAMQLHVPAGDHVNNHAYCLHWWRPLAAPIPRPPAILVGIKEAGDLTNSPEKATAVHLAALER
jgi:hypothetical protein